MNAANPLIIAHRGASAFAPENTFAAFRKAIDLGADGIELDVRLAKGGVPVVFHDANLRRLTRLEHRIADVSAEDLNRIEVGSWFNRAFPGRADARFTAETIPTLAQLLDFLADYRGLLYVELKGGDSVVPTLTENVCELLRQTNLLPNIVIKSFKLESLRIARRLLPEARAAALFEPRLPTIFGKRKHILEEARKCGADEISIHRSLATKKFLRQAVEFGLPTLIWTADNPVWVKRALNFGISAIITNDPERLLAERDRLS